MVTLATILSLAQGNFDPAGFFASVAGYFATLGVAILLWAVRSLYAKNERLTERVAVLSGYAETIKDNVAKIERMGQELAEQRTTFAVVKKLWDTMDQMSKTQTHDQTLLTMAVGPDGSSGEMRRLRDNYHDLAGKVMPALVDFDIRSAREAR